MARAKITHDWDQTSLIWATLANSARDSKRQPEPFQPHDVHPLRPKPQQDPEEGWRALRGVIHAWGS